MTVTTVTNEAILKAIILSLSLPLNIFSLHVSLVYTYYPYLYNNH